MTSRERVMSALDHREPDRVPLFAPNVMQTWEPYDDQVRQYLDDFGFDRFAPLGGLLHHPSERVELSQDTYVDGYGCQYVYKGVGLPYCTGSPLANAETIADVEAHSWPDPESPGAVAQDARERAKTHHAQGEYMTAVGVPPLFHQYHYLRGFEQWMIDVKLNRGVHEAIADHIHHIHATLLMRLLDEVGEYTDIVTGGDDFGWSVAPYMSPDDFRTLIKPYYRDLIARIKGRFPRIKFYLHSHGQIMDLVPDLIECGIDVLNPILPLDHMDPVRLKREFGDDLCFHGGIDVEHILPFGTVGEVRDHVREVIDVLAPGGGYWFKTQVISPVIPPQNLIAAYETALEYGRYDRCTPGK
jgi:uroporphyrinogen decarboxylase